MSFPSLQWKYIYSKDTLLTLIFDYNIMIFQSYNLRWQLESKKISSLRGKIDGFFMNRNRTVPIWKMSSLIRE